MNRHHRHMIKASKIWTWQLNDGRVTFSSPFIVRYFLHNCSTSNNTFLLCFRLLHHSIELVFKEVTSFVPQPDPIYNDTRSSNWKWFQLRRLSAIVWATSHMPLQHVHRTWKQLFCLPKIPSVFEKKKTIMLNLATVAYATLETI